MSALIYIQVDVPLIGLTPVQLNRKFADFSEAEQRRMDLVKSYMAALKRLQPEWWGSNRWLEGHLSMIYEIDVSNTKNTDPLLVKMAGTLSERIGHPVRVKVIPKPEDELQDESDTASW
jgi:hypothetical protein